MDLNFVKEVQLVVEHVICAVFAAVVKIGDGGQAKKLVTNCNNLHNFIVLTTVPENGG